MKVVNGDHITFEDFIFGGCSSSFVGKQGGRQIINLGWGCHNVKTIIHEIGHAIGFWHEQSRPDRDRYVTIHWENMIAHRNFQFSKRTGVDYQGEVYDYGSIMHYRDSEFSINKRSLKTITVNNPVVYEAQGKPELGLAQHLSEGDVRQINKMYKCYEAHKQIKQMVILLLFIHHAEGLSNGEYFACAEAVSFDNVRSKECTPHITSTRPEWNRFLVFMRGQNKAWRYFEVTIWQRHADGSDTEAISRQTIWLESAYKLVNYCLDDNKCVQLDYTVY